MAILMSNEILGSIMNELMQAEASVQIITAYCKESTFNKLNGCISDSILDKRLLLRFRMDDILKGSTDFGILNAAKQCGWTVSIRFDLHAKTYIVDNKRCLIGSANLTNSGMSIGNMGNMEMATLVDIEPQDIEKIERLYADAIIVDQDLIDNMSAQINGVSQERERTTCSWDSSITSLFRPRVNTLFSYELPDCNSIFEGQYISFLDTIFDGDLERLKEELRWSNIYLWLISILQDEKDGLYFGKISECLHSALISDPKPYRKDIKQMLANLLSLIEELQMEEIVIDRPNYSQRVRLRSYL